MPRKPRPGKAVTQRKAVTQHFNPNILDRTVVAIPLLRAMSDTDVAETWMSKHRARAVEDFNAVIFLARDYPERAAGAFRQVKDLLARILVELGLSSNNNVLLQGAPRASEDRPFVVARLERRVRLALDDRDRKEDFPAIDRDSLSPPIKMGR